MVNPLQKIAGFFSQIIQPDAPKEAPTLESPFPLVAPATTKAQLAEDLALPNSQLTQGYTHTGPVRRAIDAMYSVELTPATAIRAMRAAKDLSDVPFFANCALDALRQDPNLMSLLQTRVLAVSSMALVSEPSGTKLADRKAAEAAQALLLTEPVESIVSHLMLQGTYLGYGLAQIFWDTSTTPWSIPRIDDVPSHYVVFDRTDAKTPYLRPLNMGELLQPLAYGKFIFHRPSLLAGNPVTSGIAYTALFYYTLKNSVLKDWVGFTGIYGQPIRVGKYQRGQGATAVGKADLDVMRKALANLGGDAWAMIPDNMQIEIVEAAARNASAEVYERLCRFLDEQLAKLVLGGTLTSGTGNTGSGGSKALGAVHNEVRGDIIRSDAKALANTLRRCLIKPYIEFNFGTGVSAPSVYFLIEEQQDVSAWVTATTAAMAVGLKVPALEFYKRLDIREPEAGEEVLAVPIGTQVPSANAPAPANQTATLSATQTRVSELDDLGARLLADDGYVQADTEANKALLAAIEGATTVEAVKAALEAFVRNADVSGYQLAFAKAGTAAKAAGYLGAKLEGR